jgi:hypothetical protein
MAPLTGWNQAISCKTCETILKAFSDIDGSYDDDLGSVEDCMASGCAGHTPAFQIPIRRLEKEETYPGTFRFQLVKKRHQSEIRLFLADDEREADVQLELVGRPDVPDHPGKARILDPDWIDTDLLCEWKSFCLQSHGSTCDNPLEIDPVEPQFLIDTMNNCLVPGKGRSTYLTLSYRWGQSGELKALKRNIDQLQKPQVLSDPEFKNQIPPLVQSAIIVTQRLEERYLWVDALCIVQDDDVSKGAEISRMAEIYASSIITLVATEGSGDEPLLGLRGSSPPRGLDQRVLPFAAGERLVETRETLGASTLPFGATYFTRGWTFQEYFLSKRRLVFRDRSAHWECQCANFHEGLEHEGSARLPPVKPMLGNTLRGYPDMQEYFEMIPKYNPRDLTYEEDALSAIWGLLAVMCRSFEGGFLQGLPIMFFDVAMRWRPLHEVERRKPAAQDGTRPPLPAWSWIGWKGHVQSSNACDADFIRNVDVYSNRSQTFPIVEWRTSDAIEGPWRRVKAKWFEYREQLEHTKELPPNWTRHELNEGGNSDSGGEVDAPACHYTHPAVPNIQFWFPIPIFEAGALTKSMHAQTRYVSCHTHQASLRAFPVPEDHIYDEQGNPWVLRIRDESGTMAGEVFLHCENDRTLFDEVEGSPFELVAISRGRELLDPMLRSYREVYHVLWVEWHEGVATRRAVGWVERALWEAQDLKQVHLILD